MDIKKIKNPKFLKDMKIKDLEILSKDIRKFIIDNVSKTGGHLSSNLGIVDLTIALHKVFDTPKDKIVFDVSHQCYCHKILTGRASKFNTLRQTNGLSGFQKRSESVFDSYEAGHSSTSLSAALGMALARDKNKEDYNVIAVIGDGSMGNGLSYEALNHIGATDTKLIIILNDNEMSISKNVGALHNNLDKIRSNNKYDNVKDKTKRIINKFPFGNKINLGIKNIKKSLKKLYIKEGFIFEEFGLTYYGPINGHDYNELLTYLEIAKKENNPVIIHVITEKGKGYLPAKNDKLGLWHGVPPFDVETGSFIKNDNDLNKIIWSEVISNNLIYFTEKYNKLMVITPAMEGGSKLTKYKNLFPNNFIDVGMAEEHALVLSNGLSLANTIPFVSIYSTFLQRGYDQIIHDIARMNSHVIIGIDRCGIVGEDGETHQGIYDLTFLLPIPNLVISTPKDSIEAKNLLYTAIKNNKPFCIRYSKKKIEYKDTKEKEIKIGSWEMINKGKDSIIITYGDFVDNALLIKDKLKNIDLGIVNARFQKPIDEKMYNYILDNYTNIFIYEEQTLINSLGSYLVNYANEKNYKGNIKIFAIKDEYIEQGNKEEVLKKLELDVNSIVKKIKKANI